MTTEIAAIVPAAPKPRIVVKLSKATRQLLVEALNHSREQSNPGSYLAMHETLQHLTGVREGAFGLAEPTGFIDIQHAAKEIRHVLGTLAFVVPDAMDGDGKPYRNKYSEKNHVLKD